MKILLHKRLIHYVQKLDQIKNIKKRRDFDGGAIDIQKLIGNLPRPKKGFTPEQYKYMGPYNPLNEQLKYNPENGEVLEWYDTLHNNVYEISAFHDICYDRGIDKGTCDKQMVKSRDSIPYGEMPKWGANC